MKKTFFAVILAFYFLPVALAFANNEQPTKNEIVSPSDAQQLKEAARALGRAFDIDVPDPPKPAAQPAQQVTTSIQAQNKTLADVADKSLDMVKNFVAILSSTLEKIAPHVWEVMVRQQYAKAISGLIVPWGIILLIFAYWKTLRRVWKREEITDSSEKDCYDWIVRVIPFACAFITAIWGFNRLSDSILYLVNPEYYAIKDLLEMILR